MKKIIILATLILLTAIFGYTLHEKSVFPVTKLLDKGSRQIYNIPKEEYNKHVFHSGPDNEQLIALTFDDGPDQKVTPKIIDILNQYRVKGNFFFTGQKVLANPGIVRKAYYDGHLVLNHSFNHQDYSGKSKAYLLQDFNKTNEAFEKVIGKLPVLFRPPYEILTENMLKVTKQQGLKIVLWSTDTFDWRVKDKKVLVNTVLQNANPGGIVLMHSIESNTPTAEALPEIIEGLIAKGYKIVPLDHLLKLDAYRSPN